MGWQSEVARAAVPSCIHSLRCKYICYKQITTNPSAKTRGRNLRLSAQSALSACYSLLGRMPYARTMYPQHAIEQIPHFGMTGIFGHFTFLLFLMGSADCSRSALTAFWNDRGIWAFYILIISYWQCGL